MLWPMRSTLGLPGWCLFLAIGSAAGCSRSIIDPPSPRSDASAGLVFQLQDTSTADFDVNGTTFTAQLCPGVPG